MKYINIADLKDPNDSKGRSYREVNAEKTHTIPLGSLVELESGVRLFVVRQERDCDMTPLYWLSMDKSDADIPDSVPVIYRLEWYGGYSEKSLRIINLVGKENEF